MKKIEIKKIKHFIVNFGKNYPVLSFYIISNFINSILLRLFTTGSFNIRPLFFDLAIILLFGCVSFCIKRGGKKVYYIITTIFTMLT